MKINTIANIIVAIVLLTVPAFGFKFYPISVDFAPQGQESVQNFTAVNDSSETIALIVSVHGRSMGTDGTEILEPADGDFVVFPARMVLKPEARQTIRVQYKGEDPGKLEKAYRIIVEQVPVQFEDVQASGGLRILFRYIGSMYIVPGNLETTAALTAVSADDSQENDSLKIELTNTGTSHVILQDLALTLTAGDISVVLEKDQLSDISGSNLLAGSRRIFDIPRPESLGPGDIQGEITFTPMR